MSFLQFLFYTAGAIAILSTVMMLTRLNAVHGLLYLIVSLLAVSVVFYSLGAPFIAALDIIIYAGAIMVLFVFIVMLLNLGERATKLERGWLKPQMYVGPAILALLLAVEFSITLAHTPATVPSIEVGPKQFGAALYGPYLIGVELASMLLLVALVGAYHLGAGKREELSQKDDADTSKSRDDAGGDFVRAGDDRAAGAAQPGVHAHVD